MHLRLRHPLFPLIQWHALKALPVTSAGLTHLCGTGARACQSTYIAGLCGALHMPSSCFHTNAAVVRVSTVHSPQPVLRHVSVTERVAINPCLWSAKSPLPPFVTLWSTTVLVVFLPAVCSPTACCVTRLAPSCAPACPTVS